MELTTKRYQSISYISGPLLFVEGAKDLAYGAIVNIHLPDESIRGGQVVEVSDRNAVIQVFEETTGLDLARTSISLREDVARFGVSREIIGRRFSGLGDPIDGLPPVIPEKRLPIIGAPINPVARQRLKIRGEIQRGERVVDAAVLADQFEDLTLFQTLGAFKHHVLDPMRSAGSAEPFVARTDAVPYPERRHGGVVQLARQHRQAIVEMSLVNGHVPSQLVGTLES